METNARKALRREIETLQWLIARCDEQVVGYSSAMKSAKPTYEFALESLRRIEQAMHKDEYPLEGVPF